MVTPESDDCTQRDTMVYTVQTTGANEQVDIHFIFEIRYDLFPDLLFYFYLSMLCFICLM